ncbi:MAG: hypothetical protein ACJAVX_002237 [Pseudoalteromonas rhizosphaerae]|jgi:hypothetical protein
MTLLTYKNCEVVAVPVLRDSATMVKQSLMDSVFLIQLTNLGPAFAITNTLRVIRARLIQSH